MTSHQEQQAFREGILAADITTTTALDVVLDWIATHMSPDKVFARRELEA
jgi:hypothetical protein